MSKLLIIDVQNSYMEWILDKDLLNKIPTLAENFSTIYYLWDNSSGQDLEDEIPDDWIHDYSDPEYDSNGTQIDKPVFYDKISRTIEKQYYFIRSIMDNKNHSKDDTVRLGKFLIRNGISNAQEISENPDIFKDFKKEFKSSSLLNEDFNENIFTLPSDLIEELEQLNSAVLVGGARNECLEEISLILKILDVEHSILEEYCY